MLDLSPLANVPRLLVDARLVPAQGERFQPTGFPDLGPAAYTLADGKEMLLVESAQSMANRAEAVCWDEAQGTLVPALAGLAYVHVDLDRGAPTASVLEAHRLNSPYVLEGKLGDRSFGDVLVEEARAQQGVPVDRPAFLRTVFKYDPASLLHGLFLSNVRDGRLRLPRALTSFIEAYKVRPVQSGGVKNDRVNPSGDTSKGYGNVPFARTEYTAEHITAFFSLDLRQIRGYGLPPEAERLLLLLGMYKIVRLLNGNLRLRTACDLDVDKEQVSSKPQGFKLPEERSLEGLLREAIPACKQLFANPPVTRLRFQHGEGSSRQSKAKAKAKAETQS